MNPTVVLDHSTPSLCIPFLTHQRLAPQLRIYPSRCSHSAEPPCFSHSLRLAHLTLLFFFFFLELLLSASKELGFAFLGQQHHLQPAPTCACRFCLRERTSSFHPQVRKEKKKDKNNLHALRWKREGGRLNSTSGARKANMQSYIAGVFYKKKGGRLCTGRDKKDAICS